LRQPLTEDQEREVQQLAQAIAEAASQEFEQLARTLVGSGDAPFGQAEFTIRDILLRVGAKAYEQHLTQKKLGWQTWAETAFFELAEVTLGVAAEAALFAATFPALIQFGT
jgi:hypothetical protein